MDVTLLHGFKLDPADYPHMFLKQNTEIAATYLELCTAFEFSHLVASSQPYFFQ